LREHSLRGTQDSTIESFRRQEKLGVIAANRPVVLSCIAGAAVIQMFVMAATDLPDDPFAWLQPVVNIDSTARRSLDKGDVIVQILPSKDGQLGVFAASRLDTTPEMLAVWATSIADLKKSPHVLAIHRFSDNPVLEDLNGLDLDDADIESVPDCRPGSCELKMTAAEIESLHSAADARGLHWKEEVRLRFRQLVLDRVNEYRADGFAGLPPYVDRRNPVHPQTAFGMLLDDSPYLRTSTLGGDAARDDSYFYWSKEYWGTGKPIIAVTHVDLVHGTRQAAPSVAVIDSEILATHYRTASLGVTAVVEDGSGHTYLVYINRSQVDVFGGKFGGLKRAIVERRLKSEIAEEFDALRRRLESGPPSGG
jgi:hypothetical protein